MKSFPTLPVPFVDLQYMASYYCTNLASPSLSALLTGTTDFIQRKLCPGLTHLQFSGVAQMGAGDGPYHNLP